MADPTAAIEQLLGRAPIERGPSPTAAAGVRGKVTLVTGAGGSIGSELCRQIGRIGPARLVLVEQCEPNLYQIERELRGHPDLDLRPVLASVCDEPRMRSLFAEHRPHAVFHAAAHKHVPLLEVNPGEAIRNNVFGTRVVADLASELRSERFVLISTDKAVNPTSVMGATKRLAELYVREKNAASPCRFVSVRFGNVAGSAGSVIPLFFEQIARGGPVTVTHPEMERFFMTIPDAGRLLLEAGGLCEGGEVMLLDMGPPVNILDLAEQMIRRSGLVPGDDIEIRFTGIRPGEKLREQLVTDDERAIATRCDEIRVALGHDASPPIAQRLAELRRPAGTADATRALLHRLVRHPGQTSPSTVSPTPATLLTDASQPDP